MTPGAITQIAYIVADLESACRTWNRTFGYGPFIGGLPVRLTNHRYHGKPADPVELRGVLVQAGEVNVELLQLLSPGPSAFHEPRGKEGSNIHHIAISCENVEVECERMSLTGARVVSEFTTSFGATVCFLDAGLAGHLIELHSCHARISRMYDIARQAASTWDRSELIVPWSQFGLG